MIKKFNVKKIQKLNSVNAFLKLFYKKPIARCEIKIEDYKEIIVVDFSLIGDMVMNIPFLQEIKNNCPNARLTMVVRPQAVSVLQREKLVDEFLIFDGKNILSTPFSIMKNLFLIRKVLCQINEREYDLAIEPKGDLRHIWFMHYIRANRSVSYNYTGGDYLITDSFTPKEKTKHLVDEKLDLLEMAKFTVNWKNTEPKFVQKKKNNNKQIIVGIHPGASTRNKRYRHFGLIIDYLSYMNRDIQIYVFDDPQDDIGLATGIIESIERNQLEYKVICEDLERYIEIVAECNLMICNDSSAGHIAAAYEIPTIVIFGAVRPETACPRFEKTICISNDCDCKPCTLDDCPKGTYDCLEKIDINEIYNAMEKLIE